MSFPNVDGWLTTERTDDTDACPECGGEVDGHRYCSERCEYEARASYAADVLRDLVEER